MSIGEIQLAAIPTERILEHNKQELQITLYHLLCAFHLVRNQDIDLPFTLPKQANFRGKYPASGLQAGSGRHSTEHGAEPVDNAIDEGLRIIPHSHLLPPAFPTP